MKTKQNKTRNLYQVDTDIIREEANKKHLTAGNNLCTYRNHCHLSLREAYFLSSINYSQICIYEKEGVKNMDVYFYLMKMYQVLSERQGLEEPEGIIRLF